VTSAGLVIGGACALATTRLMGYLLYQVDPRDPWTFGGALGVVALTALAACTAPARRATRTDPLQALRA
jgi:ABC-type lipoprotein release transport system permease subunit